MPAAAQSFAMCLESAVHAHGEWKARFRDAIAACRTLDVATIGRDDQCELGRWLHGAGKAGYSGLASYGTCLAKHAGFHLEAANVAATINAGRYAEASAMLDGGTAYSAASSAVLGAIIALRKEASL